MAEVVFGPLRDLAILNIKSDYDLKSLDGKSGFMSPTPNSVAVARTDDESSNNSLSESSL